MLSIRLFPVLVLLLLNGSVQAPDYYEEGVRLAEQGQVAEALATWQQAREGTPDPRIGIAYLELATEESLTGYYEQATEMYYWGFSGTSVASYREVLADEIERMGPLLEDATLTRWRDLAGEDAAALADEIVGFWKHLDLTPGTEYNERLIEHWERIAHSREHFTRSRREPYGTDDRASVYVRYGEPDLVRSGQIPFDASMAGAWITEIWEGNQMMKGTPPSANPEVVDLIVKEVRSFYTFPEYEVWVYRDLRTDRNESTFFFFGSDGDTGGFSRLTQVEGMIPNAAFSMGKRSGRDRGWMASTGEISDKIRAGLILQLMYYQELSTVDIYFGDRMEEIQRRARENLSLGLMQEMKTRSFSDMIEARAHSPREESDYAEMMPEIPVTVNQYRLLNEQNRPVLETFVQSYPQTAFLNDYLDNRSDSPVSVEQMSREVRSQAAGALAEYDLSHSVRIFGESYAQNDAVESPAPLVLEREKHSPSVLRVPNGQEGTRQLFSAELFNRDTASSFRGEHGPFPADLRGVGTTEVRQPEPLRTEPEQIEMGDLILGFGMNPDSEDRYPFRVTHNHRIPAGEVLAVHVEVYHLQMNPENISDFTLTYEVLEPNPGIIRWLSKYRSNTELTLNIQNDSSRYTENLEIKTRDLDTGSYLLRLVATDRATGQSVERELEFEVIGGEE